MGPSRRGLCLLLLLSAGLPSGSFAAPIDEPGCPQGSFRDRNHPEHCHPCSREDRNIHPECKTGNAALIAGVVVVVVAAVLAILAVVVVVLCYKRKKGQAFMVGIPKCTNCFKKQTAPEVVEMVAMNGHSNPEANHNLLPRGNPDSADSVVPEVPHQSGHPYIPVPAQETQEQDPECTSVASSA